MCDRIWYRLDVSRQGDARASVRATSTCTVPLPAGAARFAQLDAHVESTQPAGDAKGSVTITPAGRTPTVSFDWPHAASRSDDAEGTWQVHIPSIRGPAEVEVVLPPGAEFRCAAGTIELCGVWCEAAPEERRTVRIVIPPHRDIGSGVTVDYALGA